MITEHRDGRAPGLVLAAPSCTEGSASFSRSHGDTLSPPPPLRPSLVTVLHPKGGDHCWGLCLEGLASALRTGMHTPASFSSHSWENRRGRPHRILGVAGVTLTPLWAGALAVPVPIVPGPEPHPFRFPVSQPEEALAAHLCIPRPLPLPLPLPLPPPGTHLPSPVKLSGFVHLPGCSLPIPSGKPIPPASLRSPLASLCGRNL